jgi:inner membrane protein
VDTLTQAVLGAACGQVAVGHRLGRRALGWGAVGGIIPDLDTLVIPALGPLAEFQYHRGLTHALWFGPLVGPVLGHAAWRWHARRRRRAGKPPVSGPAPWIALFVLALVTHPLLDLFTSYGTQLLWPFSRHRFAIDAVAIVDPFYTVPLAVTLLFGLTLPRHPRRARIAAALGLAATTAFLLYGWRLNLRAEAEARRQLQAAGPRADVRAYPTLLQPWLRRVVARHDGQVSVGMLSLWRPHPIAWRSFRPGEGPGIDAVRATPEGRLFQWFAMGQTAARLLPSPAGQTVEIEDLRYGYGDEPSEGLWGIRAQVDAQGRVRGPVERFNRRPAAFAPALARLWRAAFPS